MSEQSYEELVKTRDELDSRMHEIERQRNYAAMTAAVGKFYIYPCNNYGDKSECWPAYRAIIRVEKDKYGDHLVAIDSQITSHKEILIREKEIFCSGEKWVEISAKEYQTAIVHTLTRVSATLESTVQKRD